jgi:hypothetical protein
VVSGETPQPNIEYDRRIIMKKPLLNLAVLLAILAAGVTAAASAAFWGTDIGPLDWERVAGSFYYRPPSTHTPAPTATITRTPRVTATPTPRVTATPTPRATATRRPRATATRVPTATPTSFSICRGDVDRDGDVDSRDLALVAKALFTRPGQRHWNPAADINGDGRVDIRDLNIVLQSMRSRRCR